MQTSEKKQTGKANHRKVQASTTLNRKYLKRPTKQVVEVAKVENLVQTEQEMVVVTNSQSAKQARVMVKRSPMVRHFNLPVVETKQQMKEETIEPAILHPMQKSVNAKMKERSAKAEKANAPRATAKELKEQAIQRALASADNIKQKEKGFMPKSNKKTKKVKNKMHFGFGRVVLALSCAAAAVFAIVYFVNLNMPDISMRVAAMQTGMDPTYPNYVPRDYSVSSITSEDGKISMEFTNGSTGSSFTLSEERSSWDTNALVSNFVKEEYGENYTIVREQGLTIYISGSNAAWVNGGKVYKIKATAGSLTNKQIKSIAVSL